MSFRRGLSSVFASHIEPCRHPGINLILAPAYGQREKSEQDVMNCLLAAVVRNERKNFLPDALVIAQGEVADHLPDVPHQAIRTHRKPNVYLDTWEFLEQAWIIASAAGKINAMMVAKMSHNWRCVQSAMKRGFIVGGVADTSHIPNDIWSKQLWTKSDWLFVPYDRLARLIYIKRGWL